MEEGRKAFKRANEKNRGKRRNFKPVGLPHFHSVADTDWRNGVFWWIQSVYVTPPHRRTGIFKQLYRHVEAMAQQAPLVRGLRLYVDKDNLTAQATYETLGMTRTAYSLFETEFTNL